ncbi:MAG: MBL fold metallo-hydrolase [Chloroflexi bacterium]|nr:MBL fold metallo-hydrolase [Chloroflexota bacterium]
MDATQLMVRGVVVGLLQANCYIVGSRRTGEAICIDPGDQPQEILALARDMGVRITRILASHAHFDHIMAVGALKDATGARFLLHRDDLTLARDLPAAGRTWLGHDLPPAPDPDAFVADADDVEIAGTSLRILHTPGHTEGSVCLYGGGMLFSGDTLFRGSIGRTDLPGGSFSKIMESITTRLLALPDDTIVLPGHMQQTTIEAERAGNPFVRQALAERRGG